MGMEEELKDIVNEIKKESYHVAREEGSKAPVRDTHTHTPLSINLYNIKFLFSILAGPNS